MKSRSEFNKLEDYKDYLVAYYAGQALLRAADANFAINTAKEMVDRLNLKSEADSTPSYKMINPENNQLLNSLKVNFTEDQIEEFIALDRHDILQNPNEK